ncbi:hypothetical protein [Bathymodiolus japonicus methanotrophic gill symbiont]|nr:hypothetical protein [Bathymodiolus japonicus methanotrophic gill symbiont]
MSGFWDIRGGVRTQNDPYEDQFSLGETRPLKIRETEPKRSDDF